MHCGAELAQVCPNCGAELPAEARFCLQCGHRLDAQPDPAPEEGAESPFDRLIPREFAEKLQAARTIRAMQGERRVVTILFCDVQGSTAMAEHLDPEDWTEIMNGAFELLIPPIYRYEGTVARLMGDAILAFFGAPIAHEDDPQRAVLAALEIVQAIEPYRDEVRTRWGLELNVRVGVNTGRVVVGAVGSDLRLEYTAMGDAINLASRMESTADPGTIQISDNTHAHVSGLFEFEDLGEMTVKGRRESVRTYRVLGRKPDPDATGARAPLAGREQELASLRQVAAELLRGVGRVVCLLGEAGIGKSRLVAELHAEWNRMGGAESMWSRSQSTSYESSHPYRAFREHLQHLLALPPEPTREAIRAGVDRLTRGWTDELRGRAVDVADLLLAPEAQADLTLEGETLQQEIFKVVEAMVQTWTAENPGVMVFDDLQWADPASVDLLVHLLSCLDRVPVLLLCGFRADRSAPAWELKTVAERESPHRYSEITLQPLPAQAAERMVDELSMEADLPESVRAQILEKAEGNPLFVEEVVRMLATHYASEADRPTPPAVRSGEDLGIPDTLQALLTARIDRLSAEVRQTLQMASVIGRRFNYRVLAAVEMDAEALRERLETLQRTELISEAARIPELEYRFRHAMTHEATYATILRKQRRRYHRDVGEAIERLHADHLEEFAPVLGHHFQEAGDPRALRYFTQAGDAAFRLYANREAVEHYSRALEIALSWPEEAPTLEDGRVHTLFACLGRALELDSRFKEALANYEQMEAWGQAEGNPDTELAAVLSQAQLHSTATALFNPEVGISLSNRALALAEALGDPTAEAKVLWNLMNLYRLSGDQQTALEYGERSLELAREHGLREQLAYTAHDIGHVHRALGQISRAIRSSQEASELWREMDNRPMIADSLASSLFALIVVGDFEAALRSYREADDISQSIGNLWGQSYSRMMIGLVFRDRGDYEQAITVCEESIRLGEQAGFPVPRVFTRPILALIYADLGAFERALELAGLASAEEDSGFGSVTLFARVVDVDIHLQAGRLDWAIEMYEQLDPDALAGDPMTWMLAVSTQIRMLLAQGQPEEARALGREHVSVLRESNVRYFLMELLLLLGEAAFAAGDLSEAGRWYREAQEEADALGSRRALWQALRARAQLAERRGDSERADRLRHRARELVEFIADHIPAGELRESFLARPDVRSLFPE